MPEGVLFDLLTWTSPAWPIGSFAYSGGIEWAVEAGHVYDRASTTAWIAALLDRGALRNDAVLFVHAWRAADACDAERMRDIAELSAASQTGFERRLEATAQGAAFRRIAIDSLGEDTPALGYFAALLASVSDDDLTYPVAAAALFASHGAGLAPGLTAWLHGTVANLISAAQRLVPLGQTDGQKILRSLRGPILSMVESAAAIPAGDPFEALGGAALAAELGGMAHETQYTRLFRT
jgi:urease accessory protein